MFHLYASCKKWVHCQGINLATMEKYSIEIILKNGSILESYFCVSDYQRPIFLIPISKFITVSYLGTIFQFCVQTKSNEYYVQYEIDDLLSVECLVSQFYFLTSISTIIDDPFPEKNLEFLEKFHNFNHLLKDFSKKPSMLFPPCVDKAARYTWESRCLENNVQYIQKSGNVIIMFITWNVGQSLPTHETALELAPVLQNFPHPDVVFISLQEVDFSAKAVVSGHTTVKDLWTKTFRRALHYAALSRREHSKIRTARQTMSSPLPENPSIFGSNPPDSVLSSLSQISPPDSSNLLDVNSQETTQQNININININMNNNNNFNFNSIKTAKKREY